MHSALNPYYRTRNLVAYNFAGFACISLVVFLLSSQPFYLTEVIGTAPEKVGKTIGTLGVVDELTAVVIAPIIGTLTDKISGCAWRSRWLPAGPRVLELTGFVVFAVAFFGYGAIATGVFPHLYVFRALFAVAVCSVMSTAVVMLHEANNSDFRWLKMAFWRKAQLPQEDAVNLMEELAEPVMPAPKNSHGKLSAVLGICTGLGAIFSVSFFLTLPVRLSAKYPDWSSAHSLRASYVILALLALMVGMLVFCLSYDCVSLRRRAGHDEDAEKPDASYFELMSEALAASRHNRGLQLAYVGGFVLRSTTVATAMFIPLLVYKFYFHSGKCGSAPEMMLRAEVPGKNDCYDGYIFLAILTGVSLTVSLLCTPIWGILVDLPRFGCLYALGAAAVCGMLGSFGLCGLGWSAEVYDPRNAACFIAVSLLGIAQIGVIIASMSLVSRAGQSLQDKEHRVIGSITGLYTLCGGIGILLIAKVGGTWSDHWVFGPFFILGLLNAVLLAAAIATGK